MFERWKERRERIRLAKEARAERALARLAVSAEQDNVRAIASASNALGGALARTFEMQAQLLEGTSKFLGVMQDLSAKKAAQVMGARGGRKKAENKKARLGAPPECALCRNPNHRPVTVEMVTRHNEHEAQRNEAEIGN